MHTHHIYIAALAAVTAVLGSCATRYQLTGISRSRILIDSRYDATPDAQAAAFVKPFAAQVDSTMSPVVGRAARYLAKSRPEGELSDLLPDILLWAAPRFGEKPDFSVYNYGGIRAAIAAGDVSVGDILDVAPFENKICFLSLKGTKVKELFTQIAARFGECVSHGVRLVIGPDSTLVSATLHGRPIDDAATYRIATLDYVAQGNDGMTAFKAKTDVRAPQDEANNVRYLIMDYFREKAAKGEEVDCPTEGRITVRP